MTKKKKKKTELSERQNESGKAVTVMRSGHQLPRDRVFVVFLGSSIIPGIYFETGHGHNTLTSSATVQFRNANLTWRPDLAPRTPILQPQHYLSTEGSTWVSAIFKILDDQTISRNVWPPRSPDLMSPDLYLGIFSNIMCI